MGLRDICGLCLQNPETLGIGACVGLDRRVHHGADDRATADDAAAAGAAEQHDGAAVSGPDVGGQEGHGRQAAPYSPQGGAPSPPPPPPALWDTGPSTVFRGVEVIHAGIGISGISWGWILLEIMFF